MKTGAHNIDTLPMLKDLARVFTDAVKPGQVVYLLGDLGTGKTTFTQFFLQACGVTETVKSPTYTLYETYQVDSNHYVHMDLYRLTDPEELYFIGIEDLVNDSNILLVEWPGKGLGVMPEADWTIKFSMENLNRTLTITSD